MKVGAINNYTFTASTSPSKKDQNPISKTGEKANLAKAAFVTGLGLGTKLLFEIMDCDFVFDKLGDKAGKIVDKQHKNVQENKKLLLKLGAWAGLVMAFIGGFALLYTLFKAPKINYEGNVNAFKKSKDMDVYIKGNSAEKEIYTQMNEKAKNADKEEKAKLKEQYMQMRMAKNKIPDFVNTGLAN